MAVFFGARVDGDDSGYTPLVNAVDHSRLEIVAYLLNHGADPNLLGDKEHQMTPLHAALDKPAIFALLRAHGAQFTPELLLHSVRYDDHETVERLLIAGMDVNSADDLGLTVLHEASSVVMVEYLIAHGAKVNVATRSGATPLHAKVNVAAQNGVTPLHVAETQRILDALLKAGADPNGVDSHGNAPLHHATTAPAIDALLNAGANPNIKNYRGNTPIQELMRYHLNSEMDESLEDRLHIYRSHGVAVPNEWVP